jgi:predicted PurR-regulated permease PerM
MARIMQSRVDPARSTSAEEPNAQPVSDEPAVSEQGMPRGADIRGVFQGGLFMLALLAALYAGREIVLPIVLAIILNLLLQPALRMLERLHLPRMLGALLLIALLFGTIVAFVTGMSGPAGSWAAKLPEGVPRLQEHLSFLRAPIGAVR